MFLVSQGYSTPIMVFLLLSHLTRVDMPTFLFNNYSMITHLIEPVLVL